MATAISECIADWLDDEFTDWELPTKDVVAWFEPFGRDVKRAWNQCPRPDYLMPLAAVCAAPVASVVRLAASATYPVLPALAPQHPDATKLVELAAEFSSDRPLRHLRETIGTVGEAARKMLPACKQAFGDTERDDGAVTRRLVLEVLDRVERMPETANLRDIFADLASFSAMEPVPDLVGRIRAVCALEARRRVLHGAELCGSAITAASVLTRMANELLPSSAVILTGPAADERRDKAEVLARWAARRVYRDAAMAFDHAAWAAGYRAASDSQTWQIVLDALPARVERTLASLAAGTEQIPGFVADAAGVVETVRSHVSRQTADAVREAIPFRALRVPRKLRATRTN